MLSKKELKEQIFSLAEKEVNKTHSDIDWSKMSEQDCSNRRKEIMERAIGILLE